jgi:hypothetical protein
MKRAAGGDWINVMGLGGCVLEGVGLVDGGGQAILPWRRHM